MSRMTNPNQCEKETSIWESFPKFIGVNLIIASILIVIFCPTCFLTWEGIKSLFPDFIAAFIFSSVLSFGGNQVDSFFDKRMSWIQYPIKRVILTIATYMAYSFIASYIVIVIYALLSRQIFIDNIPWKELFQYTTTPMLIALVFMSIFTTWSWLGEWRKSAIEAEKLKSEKLASQYQGLKDQLNPHFLFNSFNVLSNLVYEDADKSAEFIQKLSRIYRYVLEVQNEELVSLKKELDFARNYLDLQKIRFEESLQFSIKTFDENSHWIPPLSLQLILENAVKHNIISKELPLFIHIIQKENEVWISNTFQPKKTKEEPSTGVGLNNINLRYELLSNRKPEVIQNEEEFLVILPLLKIEA
jgi:sensor histidine kinase YesM